MNERRNAKKHISLNRRRPLNENQTRNSNNGYSNALNHYVFEPEFYYKYAENDKNLLLYYAAKFNNTELILSLDGANPNLNKYDPEAKRHMSPLLYAISNDNMDVFMFLLSFKTIDVNIFVDDKMNTLIHELLEFNNLKYLKKLLSHPKLDLTIENEDGDTAIYKAVQYFDNNPPEYLKIIKKMIEKDERITKTFNRRNILIRAFNLLDTKECNELLILLYQYQRLLEGREKAYIDELITLRKQFKDARHFVTHVSNQLSRRPKHTILQYLTTKPKTRFKNSIYHNSAALKVAARNYPFKGVSYNALKPYLSTTQINLLDKKTRRVRTLKK
jgi:hypothetical protein